MPQNGGTCRTGLPTTLPGFPCGRFMQKAQAKSVLREVITSRSCSRNTFSGCGKGGSPDDEGRACRSRFSAGCGEASGREAARFRAGMACAGPSGAGPRMGWRSPPSIEAVPTFFPCAPGTLRPMPPGSRPLPREPRRVEAAGSITRGNMGHYGALWGVSRRVEAGRYPGSRPRARHGPLDRIGGEADVRECGRRGSVSRKPPRGWPGARLRPLRPARGWPLPCGRARPRPRPRRSCPCP